MDQTPCLVDTDIDQMELKQPSLQHYATTRRNCLLPISQPLARQPGPIVKNNLVPQVFLIGNGFCPCQAFPVSSNACVQGQEPTLD